MKNNYIDSLKENKIHGSSYYPLHIYSHIDKSGNYFVTHHWHKEIELIYIERGDMILTVNKNNYNLHEGEFYLINIEQMHSISGVTPSLHHAIIFNPNILDFNMFDITQNEIIQKFTSGKFVFPDTNEFDSEQRNYISELLKSIAYIKRNNPSDLFLIKIKLYMLIHYLYNNNLFKYKNKENQQVNEKIKKVITYIGENYKSNISLNDISSIVYMNENYFCRFFKDNIGMSLTTYINKYRCEKAAKLLLDSNLKILEVAISCGFDNNSYFIRTFKSIKGCTPKEYRRINKAENHN